MGHDLKAIIYFLLAFVTTWVFIAANPVYNTPKFQLLALGIASLVWGIQVVGAFLLLGDKKLIFIAKAGQVCMWGSVCLLLSVIAINIFPLSPTEQLKISGINVLMSVVLMTILFTNFLRRLHLSYSWVIVWLLCLAVAVPTQAKLVGLW